MNSSTDSHESEEKLSLGERLFAGGLLVALLSSLGAIGFSTYDGLMLRYSFDQGVTQHLEQAAQASTVEIAKTEVSSAVNFIRNDSHLKRLTDKDADADDFQFWYRNLEGMQKNLEKVDPHATVSDKQIVLNSIERSLLSSNWLGREIIKLPNDPDMKFDCLMQALGFIGLFILFIFIFLPLYLRNY